MPLYLSKCRMFHNYFKDYNKKKKIRKEGEEERMEEGKILLLGIRGLKMKKTNMLSPSSKDHRKATANSHVMKFRTHKY